ncbi:MAG: type I DNA topoisomerase [Bacteroidetes bacterium]|nr:type I DNA topoisomerase [Bacteroidota bacterium]
MAKNLVIVESPAKAKTIERFLGKDYQVKSSFGHVMDLAKKGLGVDIQKKYLPEYEISEDKKKVVTELKKLAKASEMVWLATDEDREGEAISWHLVKALNLKEENIRRIVFHEITKNAIEVAIQNPRGIDHNLVNAQTARRVLDRLVGFELSPLLWKKVKPALSAGRVQSVAVRLIVEREEEINEFKISSAYKVTAQFLIKNGKKENILEAELPKKFSKKKDAIEFLKLCVGATFKVADIETKPAKRSPAPPFTTSTLQQEASRKLGFSVANTMRIAQQLYEAGFITYMRTDSLNLSDMALAMARDEITKLYGKDYVKIRKYKTKTKGAQEAHEAIRPTYLTNQVIDGDKQQQRLYELIWKRTIASQMADAELEKTTAEISILEGENAAKPKTADRFVARGEVIKFDGFLKVYIESTDEEDEENGKVLPPLTVGDVLPVKEIMATEKYSQAPYRYTEASLVKKMEELGIGRPSTYAPTISTIQNREYVIKETREGFTREYNQITLLKDKITESIQKEKAGFEKNKLFPTDLGIIVNKFLIQYFQDILDYNFTAEVEKEFDEIAQGKRIWNDVIDEFYHPFHKKIEDTTEKSKKFTGEKYLGLDPESGKKVFVKLGRFGPMVQIGETTDEEKPKFAGLKKDQSIETITLEEALELFNFPRNAGTYEGSEMIVAIGRFGPFIKHNNAYYSIPKTDDPSVVDQQRAIEIIEDKRLKDKQKIIREFPENKEVKVLRGRFGPYIVVEKQNFKIPKGTDPETLSLEDCIKISQDPKNAPKKKPAGRGKKS